MPMINCKVELKPNWTIHCVLATAWVETNNAISNSIFFTIKGTTLYVLAVTLSTKYNQKLSKLLSKGFERSVYWNDYKKSENKNMTNEYSYFLDSKFVGVNRLSVLVDLNRHEDIIKNYKVIINGKNFYSQPNDTDIKRYGETRKLFNRVR